jgi:hypothetical protein
MLSRILHKTKRPTDKGLEMPFSPGGPKSLNLENNTGMRCSVTPFGLEDSVVASPRIKVIPVEDTRSGVEQSFKNPH